MRDKDQVFIFNDAELSLIKSVFADNDELLYAVRKVLLQFPLTDADKKKLKGSITPPVLAILRKRILPEISDEFPLLQLPSILTTLGPDLKAKSVDELASLFEAKQLEIDYLAQQLAILTDVEVIFEPRISFADMGRIDVGDARKTFVNLHAYLFLLGYIDPMLNFIRSIAGQKKETVEQAKVRMERDSSK